MIQIVLYGLRLEQLITWLSPSFLPCRIKLQVLLLNLLCFTVRWFLFQPLRCAPSPTHIPIQSLKTCATILCLGVTINTTSSYVNMAVWHFSVHSVRYDLLFAILCHRQSIFKRSINVVDLEWLRLHLFCPANWPLIAFLQLHSTSYRSGSPYRWTMKICLPSPDQCRYIVIWRDFFYCSSKLSSSIELPCQFLLRPSNRSNC